MIAAIAALCSAQPPARGVGKRGRGRSRGRYNVFGVRGGAGGQLCAQENNAGVSTVAQLL